MPLLRFTLYVTLITLVLDNWNHPVVGKVLLAALIAITLIITSPHNTQGAKP